MRVGVDQAGENRPSLQLEHPGVRRWTPVTTGRVQRDDLPAPNHDRAVRAQRTLTHVEVPTPAEHQRTIGLNRARAGSLKQ
jgi:hypothetical protein